MTLSGEPGDLAAGKSGWRRRLPALVMIAVLAGVAGIVWGRILRGEDAATGCPRAPAEAGLVPVTHQDLRGTDLVPPGQVAVLARNSTNRHRLATRAAARLSLMGFAEAAPPDNDPVYPTGTLHCVGQIRFGAQGRGAARTLSLVAPCAQLVRDDREGDTVDLVLGSDFDELAPTPAAREVLRTLRGRQEETAAGGLQSAPDSAAPLPSSVLARAYPANC